MSENNVALDKGSIQEIIKLQKTAEVKVFKDEKVHFAVIPNDCKIESLGNLQYPGGIPTELPWPERIKQTVTLFDAASFAGYVNLYKDERTMVFAVPSNFIFQAIIDYHGRQGERRPEFCVHRATFLMKSDDRWTIWNSKDGAALSQTDFAEFLEDNRADILSPEPARMLEIASDLHAHTEVNFGASTKLANGQTKLRYEETVKAGVGQAGDIEIPEEFSIRIPIFYGEEAVTIRVRLRFRITGGKLSFTYKLYRPKEIQDTAFTKAVESLGTEISTTILLGNPQ